MMDNSLFSVLSTTVSKVSNLRPSTDMPYLSNPASVNGVARGARELLQPLSQPDSGHQHHLNLTDNDNGDYSCSKSLHIEMALTLTKYTESGLPGEF